MQLILKKHGSGIASFLVRGKIQRSERRIFLEFNVNRRVGGDWDINPQFNQHYSKNWGLWNHDVVEAFIQFRNSPEQIDAPYLEIQASPANQTFALHINKPRVDYHIPEGLHFQSQVLLEGRSWQTSVELELPTSFDGSSLYFGLFSCLKSDSQEFYALEPNPEIKPDFHRPDLFLPLDNSWVN